MYLLHNNIARRSIILICFVYFFIMKGGEIHFKAQLKFCIPLTSLALADFLGFLKYLAIYIPIHQCLIRIKYTEHLLCDNHFRYIISYNPHDNTIRKIDTVIMLIWPFRNYQTLLIMHYHLLLIHYLV